VSLINEALRKARQAAADHDDQRSAGRPPQAYPSRGPRRGVGPAAVALVAVLAGLAGAAGVWWIVGTASTEPDSADAEVYRTPPIVDSASPSPDEATDTETQPSTLQPDEQPDRAAAPAPSPQPATATSEPAAPAVEPPQTATPPRAKATTVVTTSGVRVYVLDAELGYATLSLGYIVFRPVRPFAEINGVDIYEGSEIAGFKVEKIEIDRVVLRDDRGPLELRVP
jgi:cytoskeletal protein RodZ